MNLFRVFVLTHNNISYAELPIEPKLRRAGLTAGSKGASATAMPQSPANGTKQRSPDNFSVSCQKPVAFIVS